MTDPTPDPANDPQPQEPGVEPESKLGEGGRKALDSERTARRDAEKRARDAEERATRLEADELRRSVAADKGLSEAQARFLSGANRDEMVARADELLAAFRADDDDDADVPRVPRERLRTGATRSSDPDSMATVADSVMRRW